jgi:hypothetical protein
MSQFFGQQQLAAQYFRPQYLHGAGGAPVQDGRSGYWRLFYYQLQEEELKKHEQKQGQEAPEGKSELAEEVAAIVPKKPRTKPRVAKPVIVEEGPKVHPRPLYQKQPEPFDVAPWLATLNAEFRAWNLSAQTLHGMLQQRKAANDDEEEIIHLLLLAA